MPSHRWPHGGRAILLGFSLLAIAGIGSADQARTVPHSYGETIIEGTPQRVVTLYQGATDTALALGIEPVGVVDSWVEKPTYRYLREALDDTTHVGVETQPSLEDIAWLRPDLIVASNHRHEPVHGLLSEIAPTVVHSGVSNFKSTLALMGQATGREARAEALLQCWNARVRDFRARIERALGNAWPQEVAIVGFKSNHARIYYRGFAGTVLDELGFRRPPNQRDRSTWGIKLTNKESIPAINADVLFVFLDDGDPAVLRNFRDWRAHPLWQALTAARNERVHRADPVAWNLGGGYTAANLLLDELYEIYGLSDQHGPAGREAAGCCNRC